MNRQLKRILDLVRKTGDRMIVTDPNGEDAYVIMGLDQYEDLISSATHEHCEDDDGWDASFDEIPPPYSKAPEARSDWSPEMDGDLIETDEQIGPTGDELGKTPVPAAQNEQEDLPQELRAAVEHDLAILESWRKEKELKPEVPPQEQKKNETEQKNDIEEDRFYLEPIE